jgi:hypothetical protein
MIQNKNQFDVFDYEEDGSFKPIFMVGKCIIEEDAIATLRPCHVIEEEQKVEVEKVSVKSAKKLLPPPIDIKVEAVNLKIDTPSKA